MNDRSQNRRKLIVLAFVFALYAFFGWWVLLLGLFSVFTTAVLGLVFAILLAFSIGLATPVKAWAKTLPVQYAIGVAALLLQWSAEPGWGGSLLTLGGFVSCHIALKCLLYCVEFTAIQALGIGIRAFCRKIMEKYGDVPF